MASCKICGRSVLAGVVMHSDCLEQKSGEAAGKFCADYCLWIRLCIDNKDSLELICRDCPVMQLMRLAMRAER